MGVFTAMNVAATGLTAQQLRMDTISENIANAMTTRTQDGGGAYRRKIPVFVEKDSTSFADENGYVAYPNVDTVTEMTNLIDSSRSYEASATAFNAAKGIASKGLELFS